MSYLLHRRRAACAACRSKCPVQLAGELDLADAQTVCPAGAWPPPVGEFAGTVQARDFIRTTPKGTLERAVPNGQMGAVFGSADRAIWGPLLWRGLHEAAAAGEIDEEWLKRFTLRVPCGECRMHWKQLLKAIPFRAGDQFAWSVEVHNAVNARLGKAEWVVV